MNNQYSIRQTAGFTLLEMLITIAIAAIIISIAVPNLSTFIMNNRMTSSANDLLSGIQTARSEAIRRQQNVVFCLSANPTAGMTAACATSGITGWIMFEDTDRDWAHDNTASETILKLGTIDSSKAQLFTDETGIVSFAASGWYPNDANSSAEKIPATAIVLCDERGNADLGGGRSAARGFFISNTGRATLTRTISGSNSVDTLMTKTSASC